MVEKVHQSCIRHGCAQILNAVSTLELIMVKSVLDVLSESHQSEHNNIKVLKKTGKKCELQQTRKEYNPKDC